MKNCRKVYKAIRYLGKFGGGGNGPDKLVNKLDKEISYKRQNC